MTMERHKEARRGCLSNYGGGGDNFIHYVVLNDESDRLRGGEERDFLLMRSSQTLLCASNPRTPDSCRRRVTCMPQQQVAIITA